ncbi:MAG: nucleoside triphosphate pyrophosphohydrolase [Litorimonas sp.]
MTDLGDTPYDRITALMDRLRADCPWDREQTFETIAPYTVEESYEVMDAIERRDMSDLKAELGDLLFQVLFHAKMASEIEAFDFADVCDGLVDKMVRRHPHVFEGADVPDWDTIKATERKHDGRTRTLDGVAKTLPALMRAEKLQKRAAKRGFDWPDTDGPIEKLREEIEEVGQAVKSQDQGEIEAEIGDLLFSVVNLARKLKVEPEAALRGANAKFTRRFSHVEEKAEPNLEALSLDEMEVLWQLAKQNGL